MGRRSDRIGLKRPLHNDGIDPAAELQADALEGTDGSEVVRNMKANRRNVAGVAYDRDHLLTTRHTTAVNDRGEKCAAYSATHVLGVDVNRIFHCKPISGPGPIRACIGVPRDHTCDIGNEIRKSLGRDFGPSSCHFRDSGSFDFKR